MSIPSPYCSVCSILHGKLEPGICEQLEAVRNILFPVCHVVLMDQEEESTEGSMGFCRLGMWRIDRRLL